MDKYFYSASILSVIFFICKFVEMRFITKVNKSLKELMIDTSYVFFSVILGLFIMEQFNNNKIQLGPTNQPQVFTDNPNF
jgi:hypothetical protein